MSGDDNVNIETILKHLIDPINSRLDKLNENFEKLQSHQILVPQLLERMSILESDLPKIKEEVQKLIYESEKREDVKKTITNPLIMRTVWSLMGIAGCFICMVIGFSYKTIDEKSQAEMVRLMKSQSH